MKPERAVMKGRASGYVFSTLKAENIDMSFPHAAGALYSTVEDLYLWDQALYTETLVARATLERLFMPHIEIDANGAYGYGWVVFDTDRGRAVAHDGGIEGFRSFIQRWVERPATMIILSNFEQMPFGFDAVLNMLFAAP